MVKPGGRRVAMWAGAVGIVVIVVAGLVMRERIAEEWYALKLASEGGEEAFVLAETYIWSESPAQRGAAERWLVRKLTVGSRSEQERALRSLPNSYPLEAVSALLRLAVDYHECRAKGEDPGPHSSSLQAAVLLQRVGVRYGAAPARELLQHLRDPREEKAVRRTAASTLGWIGEGALEEIRAALQDEDPQARAYCLYALAMMRSVKAIGEITRVAASDPDEKIRLYAVGQLALVPRRDPYNAAPVRRSLSILAQGEDRAVAEAAASALKAMESAKAAWR